MHIYKPDDIPDDVQFTGDRALLAADSIDFSGAVVISKSYSQSASEAAKHPLKLAAQIS